MNLPVGEGQRELERRTPQVSPFSLGPEVAWCPALRPLLFLLLRWEEVFYYEITVRGESSLFVTEVHRKNPPFSAHNFSVPDDLIFHSGVSLHGSGLAFLIATEGRGLCHPVPPGAAPQNQPSYPISPTPFSWVGNLSDEVWGWVSQKWLQRASSYVPHLNRIFPSVACHKPGPREQGPSEQLGGTHSQSWLCK